MHSTHIPCNLELLRRSLSDLLSEPEEDALAQHLDDCLDCQHRLTELAAEQPTWLKIETVLREESTADGRRDLSQVSETEFLPTGRDAGYVHAPLDFAVDFLAPPTMPDSLGRLGSIDILAIIGHGGMGIVLKGFQRELNRPVAVKVLAPHLATSGAARQRFAREAQAAAAIMHPNVMPIFFVDANAKLPYLVMPYVECESLQQRLDRQGSLEVVEILRIGMQVARGLAAAHAQGLVHRDVKPANILLEKGVQRVMLTDFGLARAADDASLTRTGIIAGTPQYMSPEQASGEAIDARSDLFSLGSVLYAACTGRPPFRADTSYGILRRITDTEPRAIDQLNSRIPPWLIVLVHKLLQKRPAARFASADQTADLLEQCLAHCQQPNVVELPPGLEPPAPAWRSPRRDWIVAAVLLTVTSVVVVGSVRWWTGTAWPWSAAAFAASGDSLEATPTAVADTPAAQPSDVSAAIVGPVPMERNDAVMSPFAVANSMVTEMTLPSAELVVPMDGFAAGSDEPPDEITERLESLRSQLDELQRSSDSFWDAP